MGGGSFWFRDDAKPRGSKVLQLEVSKLSVRGKNRWLPRLAILTDRRLELINEATRGSQGTGSWGRNSSSKLFSSSAPQSLSFASVLKGARAKASAPGSTALNASATQHPSTPAPRIPSSSAPHPQGLSASQYFTPAQILDPSTINGHLSPSAHQPLSPSDPQDQSLSATQFFTPQAVGQQVSQPLDPHHISLTSPCKTLAMDPKTLTLDCQAAEGSESKPSDSGSEVNSWVSKNGGFTVPQIPESTAPNCTTNTRSAPKLHEFVKEMDHDVIPLAEISQVSRIASLGSGTQKYDTFAPEAGGQVHIQIMTESGGENNGKVFDLKVEDESKGRQLVEELQTLRLVACEEERRLMISRQRRDFAKRVYNSWANKMFVSLLSHAVLGAIIITETFDNKTGLFYLARSASMAYTITMLLDVMLNIYAHGLRACLKDKWSKFEIIALVVSAGVQATTEQGNALLPLITIVRICKRMPAVRNIWETIMHALGQVLHLFDIMFAFAVVFALIGITAYSEKAPEVFGDFPTALTTVLRAVSDNPWMEDFEEDGLFSYVFRMVFTVAMQWVLLQVCVAIIINSFITKTQSEQAQESRKLDLERMKREIVNPLNPLLNQLIQLYDSDRDLSARVKELFEALDVDEDDNLSLEEIVNGFKRMDFEPRIHLSSEDLREMCLEASLSVEIQVSGLCSQDFESLLRSQLKSFCERQMTDVLKKYQGKNEEVTAYITFQKLMMSENQKLREQIAGVEKAVRQGAVVASSSALEHSGPEVQDVQNQIDGVKVRIGDRWVRVSDLPTALPSGAEKSQLESDSGVKGLRGQRVQGSVVRKELVESDSGVQRLRIDSDPEVKELRGAVQEIQQSVARMEAAMAARSAVLEERMDEATNWIKWHVFQQQNSHAQLV